ncbi:TIGR01777 family oxidoreductase [Myroides sp. LJL119]
MKILVTGATGSIGKQVVQSLLDQDYSVNYLTTNKNKTSGVFLQAKGFYWNPEKAQIDYKAFDKVDVIIHLAGSSIAGSWSKAGKQEILNSRILSSCFLQDKLVQYPNQVQHVICASAVGIYSDSTNWQDEQDYQVGNDFLADVVQKWEKQNKNFELIGKKLSLVRIGMVLQRDTGALKQMIIPIKAYLGTPLGSGKQYYSWIHIQDLVGVFNYILQNSYTGIFNAVSPHPMTNKEFTITLGKVLARPIWPFSIPGWVIKLAIGQKAVLVLNGQRVSCQKIQNKGYKFKFSDLKGALEQLYH